MAEDQKRNIDLTHRSYDAYEAIMVMARDFYEGRTPVKAKAGTYLIQGTRETEANFQKRLTLAVWDGWPETIIRFFVGQLFRKTHIRELPAELEQYQDDVDLSGTPADVFFKERGEDGGVDGMHYVEISKTPAPKNDEGERVLPDSKQGDQEVGLRPFFNPILRRDIKNWRINPQDLMPDWVVIEQEVVSGGETHLDTTEYKTQRKVWTRTEWIIYEESKPGVWDQEIDRSSHPCGQVPIVPWFGNRKSGSRSEWTAKSLLEKILDQCLGIYNMRSDLQWALYLHLNPIFTTIGPEKPDFMAPGEAFHLTSKPSGAQVDAKYVEYTGVGMEQGRQYILDLVIQVWEISLLILKDKGKGVMSADSQREDKLAFSSSIITLSRDWEAAERKCWELMAKWEGVKVTDQNLKIEYSRDFDMRKMEAELLKVFVDMATKGLFPLEPFLEMLQREELLPDGIDIEELIEQIEAKKAEQGDQDINTALGVPEATGPGSLQVVQSQPA